MATTTGFIYHTEIIDGKEIEKPLPGPHHSLVQYTLGFTLGMAGILDRYMIMPELNVACGKDGTDRLVPDISIVPIGAEFRGVDLVGGPALAVEILSPGQSFSNLLNKCERLLGCGASLCWLIWPEKQRAWHYAPDGLLDAVDELRWPLDNALCAIKTEPLFASLAKLDQRKG